MGIYAEEAPDVSLCDFMPTIEEMLAEYERWASSPKPKNLSVKMRVKRLWRFLTHIPYFIRAWIHYWKTGDCEHACEWIYLYTYPTGKLDRVFARECACPIHDWRDWLP